MMAWTGQIAVSVLPKNTRIPLLKGSIFDSFIVIWNTDGMSETSFNVSGLATCC